MVLYPNKLPESERVCSGICSLAEGKVLPEHLAGQEPKFLDFFSPDYGFK